VDLIVIHGAGGSAADHADFVAAVHARGDYVLALDLLGHGKNRDDPFLDPFGWVGHHCDGICLWGVSLGGYIALHVAAQRRDYVDAVVAIAPTTEAIIRERMDTWGVEIDPSFREQIEPADVFQVVQRIACPVLYVHARDDERIPLAVSERLHGLTPRSELVVLDSGGHSGPAHDPAVHELTLDWLERVARARAGSRADRPAPR
jgi:pimeloyl-ACP methyl ester carboxylesterase